MSIQICYFSFLNEGYRFQKTMCDIPKAEKAFNFTPSALHVPFRH